MHPLLDDCTGFTDAELQEKITRVQRVLKTSTNSYVSHQAFLILDSLQAEQQRRSNEALQKLYREQGLDGIINID